MKSALATRAASGQRASDVATLALAEIAERNPLLVASFCDQMISEAIDSGTVQAPKNWSDFAMAEKLLRTAAGLDKPQAPVQFNLWGSAQPVSLLDDEEGNCFVLDDV